MTGWQNTFSVYFHEVYLLEGILLFEMVQLNWQKLIQSMRLFCGWFKFGGMFVTIRDFKVIFFFFTGKGAYFLEELIVRILLTNDTSVVFLKVL